MVGRAVVPAAGLGTRMLTATKETPKEMLPLFSVGVNGGVCVKPTLQIIFEQLFDVGVSEFCFIVGREKRSIEDHFSIDSGFIEYLSKVGKLDFASLLNDFYEKLRKSTIYFITQHYPLGFGDAVYRAKAFTSEKPFFVHAGDDVILSRGNMHLKRLINAFNELNASAVFLVDRVDDPRRYGVIEGVEVSEGVYEVKYIVEKPSKPPSNIAVVAVYIFDKRIYEGIDYAREHARGEVQLTDAIAYLVENYGGVYAVELKPDECRLDVGTPQSYWHALKKSYEYAVKGGEIEG